MKTLKSNKMNKPWMSQQINNFRIINKDKINKYFLRKCKKKRNIIRFLKKIKRIVPFQIY